MAANEVFVDTSGFLALWDAGDQHHSAAVALQESVASKRRRFVTSDYVADETATLLLIRHSHSAAADFLQSLDRSGALRMEWVGPDRFAAGAALFQRRRDKEWSFTDCVSFAMMRELGIREALTADHHFRQAGLVPLLGTRK